VFCHQTTKIETLENKSVYSMYMTIILPAVWQYCHAVVPINPIASYNTTQYNMCINVSLSHIRHVTYLKLILSIQYM
jgi:hypothetical protein